MSTYQTKARCQEIQPNIRTISNVCFYTKILCHVHEEVFQLYCFWLQIIYLHIYFEWFQQAVYPFEQLSRLYEIKYFLFSFIYSSHLANILINQAYSSTFLKKQNVRDWNFWTYLWTTTFYKHMYSLTIVVSTRVDSNTIPERDSGANPFNKRSRFFCQ